MKKNKKRSKKRINMKISTIVDTIVDRKIEWLPFRTQRDGTEGILKKFSAVTGILFLSGILFALIDAVLSFTITYGGFNV